MRSGVLRCRDAATLPRVLANAKVVAFVATVDGGRARQFYEGVLGLTLTLDDQFALVFDSGGTTLRVAKVEAFTPAPFTVLGWRVDDIEAIVDAMTVRGVQFERYEGMPQDERGICQFPGGQVAWFRDPDGNLLSFSRDS